MTPGCINRRPLATVGFNSDGGAAVSSLSGPDGSSITLPTDTYPGYTFDGWFTAASDGTEVGGTGSSYTIPSGGITLYAQWTAIPIPKVSAVSPNSGPTSGGTSITITGTGFVSGATVQIGQGVGVGTAAIAATKVTVVSPTKITAVTGGGAKAGPGGLFVTTSGGTSVGSFTRNFTYTDAVSRSGVSSVTSDGEGFCALLSTSGVDCWGDNQYGELGNGTFGGPDGVNGYDEPQAVIGITNAISVTSSTENSYCAVLATGGVECWGDNSSGQLGNGTVDGTGGASGYGYDTPQTVSGLTDAVTLASQGEGYCALLSTGGVDCWGGNSSGDLGNGTTGGPDNGGYDTRRQ